MTEKGSIDFEHSRCLHEYDFGVIQKSLQNIEGSLEKINGLPVKVDEQGKSIGRLWKLIFVALGSAGAAIVTAIVTKL